MAKVSFNSITPIKSKDDIVVQFGDKDIVVKQYLPIHDKADLVDYIIQSSFDTNGLFSPIRLDIYRTIGLLRWYTNINFTDTMIKQIEKTYDAIILNGLKTLLNTIDTAEYETIITMINDAVIETKDYLRSFAGQLQRTNQDYNIMNMDMEKISETLQDPQQIGFLREVMEKMG